MLTALVLTKNEEDMLPLCLERLDWADERLVIDSFSTDKTVEIARQHGARVLQRTFTDFSAQLNYGIEEAHGDWIVVIDADELVTPGLRDAILQAVRAPAFDVYELNRDSVVWGRRMRSKAWSNEWIPRLFRKGRLHYEGAVHQQPVTPAPMFGKLRGGKLIHYTDRSVAAYFRKFEHYSTLWAEQAYADGRRTSIVKAIASGLWRVFHNYFFRGEILDGRTGFLLSVLGGTHTFIRHIKLWGLEHADELGRVAEEKQKR